ncbi:insulinase family protein, partial [Candidatus Woesearchaeota archaeon]|nr:insulinase family protein [Candidatus Woesearchaeota archaeon]
EGTKTRTERQIVKEIESKGGEFNAFTDHEITFFYIKILSKYFDTALDIMSDIILNPIFGKETIEKERKVILEELNLWSDDPKAEQWLLFQKALYKSHPAKYPVIGFKNTIKSIVRNDIVKYYNKYYIPNNMSIVLAGNIKPGYEKKLVKSFSKFKSKKLLIKKFPKENPQNKIIKTKTKKQVSHSYFILGYKTVDRNHNDSYALDLLGIILGMGQGSRLFNEIRVKRGLSYNVGSNHDCNKTFGYFACYVSADKKNIDLCRKLILEQLKLPDLTNKEIEEAKNMLEGLIKLKLEDTKDLAHSLGSWEYFNDAKNMFNYTKKIRKVTKKDILKVAIKYFTKNYTEVLISN